jgi:hypothetical protein
LSDLTDRASKTQVALGALVASALIGTAVYYLWYRPRQRRRHREAEEQLRREQAQLAKHIHDATTRVQQGLYDVTDPEARAKAKLGVQQALRVERALHKPPAEVGGALVRALHWVRARLSAAWQAVRSTASSAVRIVTRFAKRWTPSHWWPNTEAPAPARAPPPSPAQGLLKPPGFPRVQPLQPQQRPPRARRTHATPKRSRRRRRSKAGSAQWW